MSNGSEEDDLKKPLTERTPEAKEGESKDKVSETELKGSSDADAAKSKNNEEKGLQQSTTVFVFWAYVAAFVSLVTLAVILVSGMMPSDEETEFITMPPAVRLHSMKGKTLKIEIGQYRQPVKVFVREEGPDLNSESVVLVHGLGASSFTYRNVITDLASKGLHVIALDFPGAGLSEKPLPGEWPFISRIKEIYREISEKGIFWRFEQMIETGGFPDPEPTESDKALQYNAEDLAESLDQVIRLLTSSPVHIVLHDSSIESGLTWAIRNPALVRSISVIDAFPGSPSFPVALLGVPGIGSLFLWSSLLQQIVLKFCCVTSLTQEEAEFHAFLLRSRKGQRTALQSWKTGNTSFDVVSNVQELAEVPVQILWSTHSGKGWEHLGESLSSRLPTAIFVKHNGGRWPQEDAAEEISKDIHEFITSLPPTVHIVKEEPIPEHIQDMFDSMSSESKSHHHHDGHGHGHGHDHDHAHGDLDHGLGYMNNVGMGGWVI